MSTVTVDTQARSADDAKPKGRSNLVPALVVAAGLVIGGYFLGPGSASCTGEACAAAAEKPAAPLGEIATMDPLSVNLADGHFLKVGVAVQLTEGVDAAEFAKGDIARVKDLLIAQLAGGRFEDLTTAKGRADIKTKLVRAARKTFDGDVLDLYFTDFVMQ